MIVVSSNARSNSRISSPPRLDGLEWNVRLSEVDQGHLLDTFRATFDEYWEDPTFEQYDPHDPEQQARLDDALMAERGGATDLPLEIPRVGVDEMPAWRLVQAVSQAFRVSETVREAISELDEVTPT